MKALRFKLDEEWYDLPEGMETFGSLRNWVNSKLKDDGRVLLGILNGEASLTLDEMEGCEERPIGDFETLEFLSAEPKALACRTCEDLIHFMDVLEERGEKMRTGIAAGDEAGASEGFKDCIEGWNIALQGFRNLIDLAEIDSSVVEIGGQPLPMVASRLRGLTLKMAEYYIRGDMDSIQILMSEDMALYIAPFREAFERVQEKLEEAAV